MKAIVYEQYGSPDVLELREVKKPAPKDNEVLVKVHASSINDWDWELLQGIPFLNRLMAGLLKPSKIKILGCDIAGRVEAVGSKVTQFQPGDEVFGDLCRSGWGGFAEYVCSDEMALAIKPVSMTFEQAASIPQAGLLALQGLLKGKIQQGQTLPSQKVLINGASGGAGSFAVQIAKSFGAEVTGVCSTKKMDFVRSLGTDHVIDYTQEDFTRNGQAYDLILDVKACHSIFDYKRALSPEGIYMMMGGASVLPVFILGTWISITSNKKMGLLLHKPNKGLDLMKELFEAGKYVPVIDRCYPLSEVAEAFRYFGEGRKKGKVIITVQHTA
ncbi:NAD(P)-dependent alcohol dehydrogenase [Pseudomonadota bacterium]